MCTARHRAVAKNKKSEQNIKNCLTMLAWCDIIFFVVEVWLSLVEYFVRDEGVAGSNPVTSTIPRVLIGFEMFYKHSRFFIAFNQYADSFHSSTSILIIFLLFLFAVFRMSCVTSIFRERLHKLGVKIVFTD